MTLDNNSPVNRQGVDEVDVIAVLKCREEQQVCGDEGKEKGHPAAHRVSSRNQDGEQEWNNGDGVGVPAPYRQPEENSRDDQPCRCSGVMGEQKGDGAAQEKAGVIVGPGVNRKGVQDKGNGQKQGGHPWCAQIPYDRVDLV